MPELPDVENYVEALSSRVEGRPLQAVRVNNPFVLRTWDPPVEALAGRRIRS